MYGTTSEANFDGNSLPILPPGIYDNVKFLGVKNEVGLTKDDGSPLVDRITFNFKTSEGQPFSHSELKQDEPKKAEKLAIRVGHILSKFYEKASLVQSNTTWETYSAWVTQMGNAAVAKNQLVKLKISGSVFEGKAKSRFNGYPPFIAKAGEDLNWDNNDLKGNTEYANHQNPRPDASSASTPSADTVGEF